VVSAINVAVWAPIGRRSFSSAMSAFQPLEPDAGKMLSLTTICVKGSRKAHRICYRGAVERRNVAISKPANRQSRGSARRQPARRPQSDEASRPSVRQSQSQSLEFAELHDHIGYFLRRLQVAVFSNFIRTLAPMDVRPAQYSVMVLIAANPGRSQSAIGQALNIERARLARMLHELERRDWIERRAAPDDGRSHSLYLTDAGAKALVRIRSLAARHEERMVELIGRERRQLLLDLLREFG
jgi:DNA-binding MarR family transcriptional regulator